MNPHDDKTVGVYLPTRNRAGLLPRAAASVLNQNHRELELIIVDDSSDDATPAVIAELVARDARVRALRTSTAVGAPAARNAAIRASTARWVTGIDDDDEMLPDRLRALLAARDPRFSLISSGAILDTGRWRKPLRCSESIVTLDDELYGDRIGTQALFERTRMLDLGGFDESMKAWQDYDLWVRMIAAYGPAKRLAPASYVIHANAERHRVSQDGATGAAQFLAKHGAAMNLAQRTNQEFEVAMLRGERLTFGDALRYTNRRNLTRPLRYCLTSAAPVLRNVAAAYRRLRY
ncbi:MAG: glycosyltransferase [Gammaproteobacteria bacterium]|jgi:glycosyltransferase involved in cell wall biosynthesis|nr:glycosyltransferase [Gammaproteobacteria bacterium]